MVKLGGRPPLTWKLKIGRATACVRACAALAGVLVAGSAAVQAVAPNPAGAAESTFGPTTVGPSAASFAANHKQVSRYALSGGGTVTKLRVYLQPTTTAGQQVMKGVIYSDASGKPDSLLGVTEQLTFTNTSPAGWYDLVFSSPLKLGAGSYWIGSLTGTQAKVAGFRFTKVTASRTSNTNKYALGPSNPFGSGTTDAKRTSLYASYIPAVPPVNVSPPSISGTAQQGQTLTEAHGSWTNGPTSYSYQWLQCNSLGE